MLALGSTCHVPKEPCPSVSSPEDVIVITGRVWQQVFAGPFFSMRVLWTLRTPLATLD